MLIPVDLLVPVYLAFAAKHLVGDYLLQTTGIARRKGCADGWRGALLAHAATHAAGTLLIVLVVAPTLWWLSVVDLIVHAGIDRTKAIVARGWTMGEPRFWWAFGIDQTAHQLTHFAFVILIARAA